MASLCHVMVPKVLLLEVPDDARQRCSERWEGVGWKNKEKSFDFGRSGYFDV